MGLLHEPARPADSFPITPDYDLLLAEYAQANPDHPDPRFTRDDIFPFAFHWPARMTGHAGIAANPVESQRFSARNGSRSL